MVRNGKDRTVRDLGFVKVAIPGAPVAGPCSVHSASHKTSRWARKIDAESTFDSAPATIPYGTIGRVLFFVGNTCGGTMTDGHIPADLAAKIERLETTEEIRQLAGKYALAVDMRDLDALVSLHVEDVEVRGFGRGRSALKRHFDRTLRNFTGACHHIGNHLIEFEQADRAVGVVYCRCEHEIGEKWIYMQMLYLDTYERRGGRWYFACQRFLGRWYAAESTAPPIGACKVRWPGRAPVEGTFHDPFPAYREFWSADGLGSDPIADVDPSRFLRTMLRDKPIPKR
jgi:hypothetical protein